MQISFYFDVIIEQFVYYASFSVAWFAINALH